MGAVWSLALRGDTLYSASTDRTVRRWKVSTPDQWTWELEGEPDTAALSPDAS